MMTNLGRLVLKLEADISELQRRLKEAENAAASSGKSMGISIKDGILLGIGSQIGAQITQLITAPINIATRAIRGFIDEAFQKGQNFEQFESSLKTILGDATKAKKLITELAEFARTTPFELPELQAATRSLLSYGFESEKLIDTLRRVGDVSSALSLNINELAVIYGKGRVAGRLYQGDINELTGRGIPIIQEFAKQFGVTDAEIRKLTETGRINFPQLEKAFISLTSEGGKFFDQMKNQSQTVAGQLSNFNDQFTGAQVALFDALKPAIVTTIDSVSQIVAKVANTKGLWDEVGEVAKDFSDTLKDNPELIESAANAIQSAMVEGLKSATELAKEFSSYLKENPDSIAKTIELMKVFLQLLSKTAVVAGELASATVEGYTNLGVLTGLIQPEAVLAIEKGIDPKELQDRVDALKDIGPQVVGKNATTVTEGDFIREAANQIDKEKRRSKQIANAIKEGRSPDRLDFVLPEEATQEDFREAIRKKRKIGLPPESEKEEKKEEKKSPPKKPGEVDPTAALDKQVTKAIELELKRNLEVTKLVKKGVLTQEQGEVEKLKATEKRIKVEISAETEKLKGLKGPELDKAKQGLIQKQISLLETQMRIEKSLEEAVKAKIEKEAQALQRKIDKQSKTLEISNQQITIEQQKLKFLDKELSAINFLNSSLERQKSLRDSIAELELSRLSSVENDLDIQLGNLERARGLARDLASGRLSRDETNVIQRDLASIGLNPMASELEITQRIAAISQQRRQIEQETLEKQQELARKNLDFEQQRLELSKQRAAIESQQAIESAKLQALQTGNQARQEELSAQGKVLDAQTALKTASNPEEKAIAQDKLNFAQQEIALAREKLQLAQISSQLEIEQAEKTKQNTFADLQAQEKKLAIQKEQLKLSQESDRNRLDDRQRDQRFDQQREIARARNPQQPSQSPSQPQSQSQPLPQWQRFAPTSNLANPIAILSRGLSAPGNILGDQLQQPARISEMINRPTPTVPPLMPESLQPNSLSDIKAVTGKLDTIIDLLKRPPLVQNNTFNQSPSSGSSDADLFRRLRNQTLQDLKTVADQISLF
jgi:tape measure domain-containing protein